MAVDPSVGDSTVSGLTLRLATADDFGSVLALAAEVEHLFGAMVSVPGFHQAVNVHIGRGTALLALSEGVVVGGVLFDPEGPEYQIDWIVVSADARGLGVGTALMRDAEARFTGRPGRVNVKTFGSDHPGAVARDFYFRLGDSAGLVTEPGPEGGSRQWFFKEFAL